MVFYLTFPSCIARMCQCRNDCVGDYIFYGMVENSYLYRYLKALFQQHHQEQKYIEDITCPRVDMNFIFEWLNTRR